MPDQEITLTDEERDLLERVRQQQGLETIEQAAEWLAKSRLRKNARLSNERVRSLRVIGRKASA